MIWTFRYYYGSEAVRRVGILMGGPGSGRPKSRHRTVESCLALDADWLSSEAHLRAGLLGLYHYGNASLGLRIEADVLYLFWRIPSVAASSSGGEWEITDIIPLERRPRYFGGFSYYFCCPGLRGAAGTTASCGRRVLRLYLMHDHFRCKHCHRLVYASPYEQKPWQRAFRRARMLRQRLGSDTGPEGGAPEKPDDMPVEVYARLLDEILQAETQAYQARAEWTQRFVARIVERSKPPFTL